MFSSQPFAECSYNPLQSLFLLQVHFLSLLYVGQRPWLFYVPRALVLCLMCTAMLCKYISCATNPSTMACCLRLAPYVGYKPGHSAVYSPL